MRCLDLFAGVGGIRLGMEQAGFETVYSNDFNKWSKVTFDANHSDPSLTLADITKVDEKTLPEFDVLVGGFPCQAFSSIGARGGFEDKTKGTLFFDMLRIMKHHRPRMALMENVKGLINHDKGKTFQIVLESLRELGYHVHWKLMKSSEYSGVPQMRPRVFLVSFREKEDYDNFAFPEPIPPKCSAWDLIQWGDENSEGKVWLDTGSGLSLRIKDLVPTMSEKVFYNYRYDRGLGQIKTPDLCPTLLSSRGSSQTPFIVDGGRARYLTGREAFRLQGFPEEFILPQEVNHTQLIFQSGNSVTVPLIKRIGERMMAATKSTVLV